MSQELFVTSTVVLIFECTHVVYLFVTIIGRVFFKPVIDRIVRLVIKELLDWSLIELLDW